MLNNGKSDRHTSHRIRGPSSGRRVPAPSTRPTSKGLARGQQEGTPAATTPELLERAITGRLHQRAGPRWPSASPAQAVAPGTGRESVGPSRPDPPLSSPLVQEWCRGRAWGHSEPLPWVMSGTGWTGRRREIQCEPWLVCVWGGVVYPWRGQWPERKVALKDLGIHHRSSSLTEGGRITQRQTFL